MNALVDMYGKCGEVENAHQLFDKMHVTDVVPCNAVLGVFARCGKDMESVTKMFNGMAMVLALSTNASSIGSCPNKNIRWTGEFADSRSEGSADASDDQGMPANKKGKLSLHAC
ncbi:hypothetical protein QQ045_009151 [Rhodiola kirilowii]